MRYFNLIAAGRKTTEIRVNDPSHRKIKKGSLIRFTCRDDEALGVAIGIELLDPSRETGRVRPTSTANGDG